MTDMTAAPAHAKPGPRRDHLWVLVIIAACCLVKVWPSWVGIGAEAAFPKLGKMATDWTLAVVVEAYWAYAVYAWLAAPAGRRSRRFAVGSAVGVFALSLIAQSTAPVLADTAVKVLANALPVTILMLVAVLVHLRRADRAEAEEAERQSELDAAEARRQAAESSELAGLRAELEAARTTLEPVQADLVTARTEMSRLAARAETLERKLATATGRKQPRKPAGVTGRKPAAATARKQEPATAPATAPEAESDVDREALVLKYLADGHSASEAGRLAGLTDSRGRQIARKLATAAPKGPDAGQENGS